LAGLRVGVDEGLEEEPGERAFLGGEQLAGIEGTGVVGECDAESSAAWGGEGQARRGNSGVSAGVVVRALNLNRILNLTLVLNLDRVLAEGGAGQAPGQDQGEEQGGEESGEKGMPGGGRGWGGPGGGGGRSGGAWRRGDQRAGS
jgi:hypothetical protein